MELKNQVCTLEQAKKLEKLGVFQKSLFYYNQELTPTNPNLHYYGYPQQSIPVELLFCKHSNLNKIEANVRRSGGDKYFFEFAAFSVAELGVMMSDYLVDKGDYKESVFRHAQ